MTKQLSRQLMGEHIVFASLDSAMKKMMTKMIKEPNVAKICLTKGLKKFVTSHILFFSKLEKSLLDYLELKRQAFLR